MLDAVAGVACNRRAAVVHKIRRSKQRPALTEAVEFSVAMLISKSKSET
jgi:hypothetical protein